jgi:microcystin-dependent protein
MDPFIGQIQLLPYNFAPQGWAPCDGQTLSINQNTALFSLLGTNFGGDGQTTFALPTLKAPAAGLGYYIALQGVFPNRG